MYVCAWKVRYGLMIERFLHGTSPLRGCLRESGRQPEEEQVVQQAATGTYSESDQERPSAPQKPLLRRADDSKRLESSYINAQVLRFYRNWHQSSSEVFARSLRELDFEQWQARGIFRGSKPSLTRLRLNWFTAIYLLRCGKALPVVVALYQLRTRPAREQLLHR